MVKKKPLYEKTPLERFEENVLPLPEEVKKRARMLSKYYQEEKNKTTKSGKKCSKCSSFENCYLYWKIRKAILKHSYMLSDLSIVEEIGKILASVCTWYKEKGEKR